jgi:hypothetical protein
VLKQLSLEQPSVLEQLSLLGQLSLAQLFWEQLSLASALPSLVQRFSEQPFSLQAPLKKTKDFPRHPVLVIPPLLASALHQDLGQSSKPTQQEVLAS